MGEFEVKSIYIARFPMVSRVKFEMTRNVADKKE